MQLLGSAAQDSDPYSKADLLAYLDLCYGQADLQTASLNIEVESDFCWLPFDKLELQFYNIHHIQHHTGELCERLGAHGEIEVGWVGMKPQ